MCRYTPLLALAKNQKGSDKMSTRKRNHQGKSYQDVEYALLQSRLNAAQQTLLEYITATAIADSRRDNIIKSIARILMMLGNNINQIDNNISRIARRYDSIDYSADNMVTDTLTDAANAQIFATKAKEKIAQLRSLIKLLVVLSQPRHHRKGTTSRAKNLERGTHKYDNNQSS